MPLFEMMRDNTKVILWITVVAFVGLIFLAWGADFSSKLRRGGAEPARLQPWITDALSPRPIPRDSEPLSRPTGANRVDAFPLHSSARSANILTALMNTGTSFDLKNTIPRNHQPGWSTPSTGDSVSRWVSIPSTFVSEYAV